MRVLNAVVMSAALLGGSAIGAVAQDADWPTSTSEALADYVTTEVEPGVLALSDATPNYERALLEHAGLPLKPPGVRYGVVRVALDGTVWTAGLERTGKKGDKDRRWFQVIASFDGEDWTVRKRRPAPGQWQPLLDIGPDGTVWASWLHKQRKREHVVASYGPDGWQPLGRVKGFAQGLHATDDGAVWFVTMNSQGEPRLYRHVDGALQRVPETPDSVDISRDGTVWGDTGYPYEEAPLARFDGDTWEEFELPLAADGSPLHGGAVAAPDGSVWVVLQRELGRDELGSAPWCAQGHTGEGLGHFDGQTWSRYLADHCVEHMWVAPDGTVLVWARENVVLNSANYLILPELADVPAE